MNEAPGEITEGRFRFSLQSLLWWTALLLLLLGYVLRFDFNFQLCRKLEVPPAAPQDGSMDAEPDWDNSWIDFYLRIRIQPQWERSPMTVIEVGDPRFIELF